jgi:hypothetical protein
MRNAEYERRKVIKMVQTGMYRQKSLSPNKDSIISGKKSLKIKKS